MTTESEHKAARERRYDLRTPIIRAIYDVCQAIEECGASEKLTHAVTLASALMEPVRVLLEERDALREKTPNALEPIIVRDGDAYAAIWRDEYEALRDPASPPHAAAEPAKSLTPNLDRLTALHSRLGFLLANMEPGLSSWREALQNTLREIASFLPVAAPPKGPQPMSDSILADIRQASAKYDANHSAPLLNNELQSLLARLDKAEGKP